MRRQSIIVSAIIILLLTYVANSIAATTVWVGLDNDVEIYDFAGNYISEFGAGSGNIGCIAVVGDTVWIGIDHDVKIYDFGGNYISEFNAGYITPSGIAVIGDAVWVGIDDDVKIYDFTGNYISEFDAGNGRLGCIAVIGDTVWIGIDDDVKIYDFIGNYISEFNTGYVTPSGIAVIGNAVWVGIDDDVKIYDFAGNYISEFDAGNGNIGCIAVVGDTVWIGIDGDIKIYDFAGNYISKFDTTYNPSGIAVVSESADLLLLDPNGGESLTSGKAYPIKWSSAGIISNVLIEYSVDNGSSWAAVSPPNVGNSGLYNWLVPAKDSNQCLVRVSDASDPNIKDISDDIFTIEPTVVGYIEAWGNNDKGQCDVPKSSDFVSIAAGWTHSLALKSDGSLKAWGNNNDGQCDVPLGNDFIHIAGGENHSLALKFNGELMAWGNNDRYQCKVPVGVAFLDMDAGPSFSLGLTSAGYLMGWGYNIHGQVGVPPGDDFIDVAAGGRHGMALRTNRSLIAWGDNSDNQCDVPIGHDFTAIAAGTDHSLALKLDGSIVAWGHNGFGECNVPDGNDFVDIAAGLHYSLALKSDGSLVGWGYNSVVQVGVPSGDNYVSIAGGGLHALALVHEPDIGGYIDWTDLIAFCERWLVEGCSDVNDWCGWADINRSSIVDSVDYSWLAKYWGSIAPEPNAAGHPEPGDGASEVSITADLSWTAGADTAAHGVYFGTNPTPDVNEFGGYQTATIFDPGTMAADTTYYWQVDEVGLGGETAGDVWSFTTSPVPGKAYNPSPSDSATDVSINANLSWTANFYTTSHDVYFGTNPTPGAGEFEGNQTSTTFEPGTLDYETTYYWRIDGVGPGGTTTGIIWSFTTEAPPVPGKAGSPIPADMATDVNVTTCLSWAAGLHTESHDVYFGTNPIPDVNDFQGNQATTTFCPPESLEYNTTYYWRIDEKNPYNTTMGDVWSFTTMQDPNLVGWWKFDETSGVIAYDSSGNGNHGQLVDGLGNGLVWVPGEGALNFDGSNNLSRVVVSTVGMSTTEGAIGFWVKLAEPQNRGDGRNGSGYFFGCDNGVKDRILLYMDNSNTELDVRIGDHSETNIITLGTLVWYHIALTWDSGSYVVYLNGIVMSAGVYDGLTTFPSTADIGNNGGSSKQSLHGLMGDVRVYDKSISTPDIHELYEDVIY